MFNHTDARTTVINKTTDKLGEYWKIQHDSLQRRNASLQKQLDASYNRFGLLERIIVFLSEQIKGPVQIDRMDLDTDNRQPLRIFDVDVMGAPHVEVRLGPKTLSGFKLKDALDKRPGEDAEADAQDRKYLRMDVSRQLTNIGIRNPSESDIDYVEEVMWRNEKERLYP